MSNFAGHAAAGSGVACVIGAAVAFSSFTFFEPIFVPAAVGVCFLFSLFPDLDTASIPQRWFYRFIFLTLCGLFYSQLYEIASIVAIVSLVPVLHKHRGLTHYWSFSIIFPIMIIMLSEAYVFKQPIVINNIISKYGIYILSAYAGWWTHLIIDLKK